MAPTKGNSYTMKEAVSILTTYAVELDGQVSVRHRSYVQQCGDFSCLLSHTCQPVPRDLYAYDCARLLSFWHTIKTLHNILTGQQDSRAFL